MEKKNGKPAFDFGEPSDSLAKVLTLLRPRRKPGTTDDDALVEWVTETLIAEELRRVRVMADHYGIDLLDPHGDLRLAWRVARDFVPRFNPVPSRGRPSSTESGIF